MITEPMIPAQPSASDEQGYYEKRMSALGITAALNQVKIWGYNGESKQNELMLSPVFKEHPRGIEIIPYSIDRRHIRIEKEGSRMKKDWSIVRLQQPIIKDNGDIIKYLMPKGQGSYPLYSPNILEAYETKSDIHTVVLTEGFFKAWAGYMAGLHMIGLPSITHMKDKDRKTMHPEIIDLMQRCNVRHMIWLTDGDALDISRELETIDAAGNKQLKDLYRRPNGFYASINTFSTLLYDYKDVRKFWAYIDIENIIQRFPNQFSRDDLKGLDDLLLSFPDKRSEIVEDMLAVSKPGEWFNKFDITVHTGKVREHFHLDNPTRFYLYHMERRPELKDKEFVFSGTQYKYNESTGECDIVIPARAKDYFRVGDDYYKTIFIPNKYGQKEKTFKGRRKGTIVDDHGKDFVKHIPKYESFCNVPKNINYQAVIDNCYNVYNPIEHQPLDEPCSEEDCPTILKYLVHVFGERRVSFIHPKTKERIEYRNIDLALDYLQIAYKYPAEKLPILCLVSKENNTGKSTFGNLLRAIFGSNVAIVGNQDLAGDFNSHWATKLFVVCDEAKIDKQHVVEKVKSLSTANKITMNAKGKDHVEIDCFIKFLFITNNEDNFIYVTDDDIRYWINKVPVLTEENPNIMENFIEEIPAFLSYLQQRNLKTERLNRMWFHPSLLKTEALKKVIENSRQTIQKEIREYIRDMFKDFGVEEILMTSDDIKREVFKGGRYERFYITKTLKEEMKLSLWNEGKTRRYSFPRWDQQFKNGTPEVVRVEVNGNGRPFVFSREAFLTAEEIANIHVDAQTQFENNMNGYTPVKTGTPGQPEGDDEPF